MKKLRQKEYAFEKNQFKVMFDFQVNKEITDHNQYVDTKARLDKMAADKVVFLKVIEDRRKLELSVRYYQILCVLIIVTVYRKK